MHSALRLMVFVLVVANLGCAAGEKKPSYAELVSIYSAEAQELDRLEEKRASMVAEYEATLQPSGDDALEALAGVLGDMKDASSDAPDLSVTDPNKLLDHAVASAENFEAQTDALLEAAAKQQSPASREEIVAMYSDEFKAQLAEMDAQIAKQRERVEKARAARDAAEAE